jgi:broad specificity phosphatase PhoE
MSAAWPVMARELYIVRHGQVGFKQHYDAEVQEWKLTPLGRQQATWLGKYLREKHRFNGTILVSPILRTIETGVIVADILDKKVTLEPGIQEVNPGDNTRCMTREEIEKRFPGKVIVPENFVHPWRVVNENPEIWKQRYIREMDRILKAHSGDLLLVTHGGGIDSMVGELCRRGNMVKPGLGFNCALFIFTLDEKNMPISVKYAIEYIPREDVTDNRGYPNRD